MFLESNKPSHIKRTLKLINGNIQIFLSPDMDKRAQEEGIIPVPAAITCNQKHIGLGIKKYKKHNAVVPDAMGLGKILAGVEDINKLRFFIVRFPI